MIGMQYEITLPNDYNMNIIRKRVADNGAKIDGFQSLIFKAYLIQDEPTQKTYAPLYLWNNQDGMNKFIFEGYYDNILKSFGWQKIKTTIPAKVSIHDDLVRSKYATIFKKKIDKTTSLASFHFDAGLLNNSVCQVVLYNPEIWEYEVVDFYVKKPSDYAGELFEVLHISQ
jgi:hypothetical protein